MATLIREPSNQYDPNAIRVDNLAGTQAALAYLTLTLTPTQP